MKLEDIEEMLGNLTTDNEDDHHDLDFIEAAPGIIRELVERVRATDKIVLAAISERDDHHHECKCFFCEAVDAYKTMAGLNAKEST